MKTTQTSPAAQKKNMPNTEKKMQHRPEIRDNLDSRKNEEQSNKGDDTTHNKKETHKDPKKQGK